MSVKKVNLHVATEVRDAIRSLAQGSGVSITDFIENQKNAIGNNGSSDISEIISKSGIGTATHASRATVKVLETTRSFIKELSEKHNVPMSVVIGALVYKTTGDNALNTYLNLKKEASSAPAAPQKKKMSQVEAIKELDEVTSKKSESKLFSKAPNAREKAQERGKQHQKIANLSVEEIHSLAQQGNKKAKEIIAKRDKILAEEEAHRKEVEARKIAEKNHLNKKEGDVIVSLFKKEAEEIKTAKEEAGHIKTIIKEILVKDVDFHDEDEDLKNIRNQLDALLGKLDIIKPYAPNTSYQMVNELKRTINVMFVTLNRYCSLRTRLYLRQEKEQLEQAS